MTALIERDRQLEAWTCEDGQARLILEHALPCPVALTTQRIAGLHYYALEIESGEDTVMLTLGTSLSSGMAVASRKTHLRFAQFLVDPLA
ncbi:hypothetical protein BJ978_002458 [Agromyces terreus]|uniref:Uncharacterized protein n=1 Tax=Agromyces terreus TaxID=424795 RepID=A0A9X2H003_9MICO|nr:hypothetical protein [Agromyces terreus]MCP2371782.1 hypothetical protein [Agromyces terreus]